MAAITFKFIFIDSKLPSKLFALSEIHLSISSKVSEIIEEDGAAPYRKCFRMHKFLDSNTGTIPNKKYPHTREFLNRKCS